MDRGEYIRQNVEQFHNNTAASRYQQSGLTDQSAKLNNAGFNKLMDSRGISQEARSDLKNSFSSNSRMEVRHAHAGERFVTTHGIERSSGVFVSKESLGNTPADRINNGALPHTNTADLGAQRSAGGADRQAGDQGGHLIADRFGGRNDPTNLDAQAANVNQKDQANVERNVANLAANPNNTVSMNVSNFNSVGERPDATMINVGVQDNTTGAIDEQHISFQNASHEMQQSWNDTANQADQTVDSSQNAGMTDEQIDIANDLCGAEDDVDDRLGSGWEHTDFDTSFLDAGITESEAPASAEVSSGESEGASEGVGEDNSGEGGSGGEDDGLGE